MPLSSCYHHVAIESVGKEHIKRVGSCGFGQGIPWFLAVLGQARVSQRHRRRQPPQGHPLGARRVRLGFAFFGGISVTLISLPNLTTSVLVTKAFIINDEIVISACHLPLIVLILAQLFEHTGLFRNLKQTKYDKAKEVEEFDKIIAAIGTGIIITWDAFQTKATVYEP